MPWWHTNVLHFGLGGEGREGKELEREGFHFPRSLDLLDLQRIGPVRDIHAGHRASGLFDMGGIQIGS